MSNYCEGSGYIEILDENCAAACKAIVEAFPEIIWDDYKLSIPESGVFSEDAVNLATAINARTYLYDASPVDNGVVVRLGDGRETSDVYRMLDVLAPYVQPGGVAFIDGEGRGSQRFRFDGETVVAERIIRTEIPESELKTACAKALETVMGCKPTVEETERAFTVMQEAMNDWKPLC